MQVTDEFVRIVNYITGLVPVFLALTGWGGLVAIVINLGKSVGLIKDGVAPKLNLVFNLVGFVALAALGLFANVTPEYFDNVAGAVASMLIAVLGMITQFASAIKTHGLLSAGRVPLLGKSYSREQQQAFKLNK